MTKTRDVSPVTFPLHIQRDVWERFKARAHDEQRSAHAVLVKYVETYASKHPARRSKSK